MTATKVFDDIYLVRDYNEFVALVEQLSVHVSYHRNTNISGYPALVDTRGTWEIKSLGDVVATQNVEAEPTPSNIQTTIVVMEVGGGLLEGGRLLTQALPAGHHVVGVDITGIASVGVPTKLPIKCLITTENEGTAVMSAVRDIPCEDGDFIPLWFKATYANGRFKAAKLMHSDSNGHTFRSVTLAIHTYKPF